ncbi:hypothetical protein J1614_009153 [Plenodomus biglobosus]|nr:hypothetical protein J1614_009153 [Plenodomus biglobosus]
MLNIQHDNIAPHCSFFQAGASTLSNLIPKDPDLSCPMRQIPVQHIGPVGRQKPKRTMDAGKVEPQPHKTMILREDPHFYMYEQHVEN